MRSRCDNTYVEWLNGDSNNDNSRRLFISGGPGNNTYLQWLNGDSNNDNSRLLWISGGPGKGKTMMSIFLTEELTRHTADSKTSDVVFFFCGAGDEDRNTAVNVLRGLVHQILEKRPQLIGHVLPYFEPPERARQTLSSLEALWLIFSKLVADHRLGTIFCVLDGLDECEEESMQSLLQRILGLLNTKRSNAAKSLFKLAIVSRDIPVLRGCTTVKLDPDNNQEIESDISTFVRTRIKDLFWIEGFEHIRESVQTALLERAEGTFLWVGFAMHELLQKRTCKQIQETLKSFPGGLPAIYGRMLLRIPPDQRNSARTLLQWVALAARPLRLSELAAAIFMPESLPQVEIEQATRDLIILCGPLLRIEETREVQRVSLVHQSVRDYLLRSDCDSHAVLETFRFNKAASHLQLANRCLDCIQQSILRHSWFDSSPSKPLSGVSTLLWYAVSHWPEHVRQSSALAAGLFESHAFFKSKSKVLRGNWWGQFIYWTGPTFLPQKPPPLLHMASALGLVSLIEFILAERDWWPRMHRRINKRFRFDTPLHLAIAAHRFEAVQFLVQKGAEIHHHGSGGFTALHLACVIWNESIVRLLLDSGADVTTRDSLWGVTALQSVVRQGNETVVRLFLDEGADIGSRDSDGYTALHDATCNGDEAVMKLLIERGADVNAGTGKIDTPIRSAVSNGNLAAVKVLVNRGVDVDAKSASGHTLLHDVAVRHWEQAVDAVELLLDCGADINARTPGGETALALAVRATQKGCVQVLLDRGADTKVKSSSGHGLLYEAVRYSGEDGVRDYLTIHRQKTIMCLLIERGADIEELNNDEEIAAYRNCERLFEDRYDELERLDFG